VSERVVVGTVRRTRGLRGELVVESQSDLPDRFEQLDKVYLVTPTGERQVTIRSVRPQAGREIWICLAEVKDRELAMGLRGATLEIDAADRPEPPPGEYYYDQLEGLRVVDESGKLLGTISQVIPRGAQDLYSVTTEKGEFLVPATDTIVKKIDLAAGLVVINPPAGLLGDESAD
jgi:16S rRNA processing protein RimM